jgi:AMMECR1 domain-containing protein
MQDARSQFRAGRDGFYAESKINAGVLLPRDIYVSRMEFDNARKSLLMKMGLKKPSNDIQWYVFGARVFIRNPAGDVSEFLK